MEEFWIVLSVLVFGGVIIGAMKLADNSKEWEAYRRTKEERDVKKMLEAREKYKEELAVLSLRLGECVMDECVDEVNPFAISSRVLVFEQSGVLIVHSNEYSFSDILGYSLVDDATNETITASTGAVRTSTGNMLGRAVVGGILTGGLGAIAGAATAKKTISDNATSKTVTTHGYTLYINVNSLQEPTISVRVGDDTCKAQKLAGLLNAIIVRNKR